MPRIFFVPEGHRMATGSSAHRSSLSLLPALAFLLCLTEFCYAQSASPDSQSTARLGIHGDAGIASYRDDLLVPLSFDGPAFSLGALYTWESSHHFISARFRFGAGLLKNRFSHKAYSLLIELRPSWLITFTTDPDLGAFRAGICLPLQMNNLFLESWDDAHLYWLTAYMLGGAAGWEKRIFGEFDAQVHIEIPLVGFVSRPPTYRYDKQEAMNKFSYHFTAPNSALRFATLDTYRSVFLQLLVRRQLPSSSAYRFGLEFQYRYCSYPSSIQGMNTSVLFSYEWGL